MYYVLIPVQHSWAACTKFIQEITQSSYIFSLHVFHVPCTGIYSVTDLLQFIQYAQYKLCFCQLILHISYIYGTFVSTKTPYIPSMSYRIYYKNSLPGTTHILYLGLRLAYPQGLTLWKTKKKHQEIRIYSMASK